MDNWNEILKRLEGIDRRLNEQDERLAKIEESGHLPASAAPQQYAPLAPPPAYVPEEAGEARRGLNWEVIFGGNWLARIGAVAIIIGLGFFLAMAISNGWIGPVGQIVLGVVVGLVMLALGELFREKYSKYAQALTGGGIGALYVSILAAFAFHSLIGVNTALILMAVVTVVAAMLAVYLDALAIAVLGIFGGYVTPILLGADLGGAVPILAYTLILNLGILAISRYRAWNDLIFAGVLGSVLVYWMAYAQYFDEKILATFLIFLNLYFITFLGATLLSQFIEKKRVGRGGVLVITVNVAFYYIWSYALLLDKYEPFLGIFTLAVAALYVGLAVFAFPRRSEDVALSRTLSMTAVTLLVVAVPVQFSDQWITIAWAAEAFALVWLGLNLQDRTLRAAGAVLSVFAIIRLILFDLQIYISDFTPIFNERFFTFIVVSILLAAIAWLYSEESQIREKERHIPAIAGLGAVTLMLIELSSEVLLYYKAGNEENLALSVLWIVYAAVVLFAGIAIRSRATRLWSIALLGLAIVKVFVFDTFALGGGFRVAAYLILGGILFGAGLAYQKHKGDILMFLKADDDEGGPAPPPYDSSEESYADTEPEPPILENPTQINESVPPPQFPQQVPQSYPEHEQVDPLLGNENHDQ